MTDEEFVTEEQVVRWLPPDVAKALNPHEHDDWIEFPVMGRAKVLQVCKVPGCGEQQWVTP